jgi:putative hydrolase of the HAD superfamily
MIKNNFKLITFDFLGTLVNYKQNVSLIYSNIAKKKCSIDCDPSSLSIGFSKAYSKMNKKYPNFGWSLSHNKNSKPIDSKEWWREIVYQSFMESGYKLNSEKLSEIASELFEEFSTNQHYQCFEEVNIVLESLKLINNNLKIGIISNNDERVHKIVSSLGLQNFFDFILTSKEVGYQKPEKEIFIHALNIYKIEASSALHVGDNEINDYMGATSVGMKAKLVLREGEKNQLLKVKSEDIIPSLLSLIK